MNLGTPDKVPFIELVVDEELGKRILGRKEPVYDNILPPLKGFNSWFGFIGQDYYNPKELCEKFQLDGWAVSFMPEVFWENKDATQKHGDRTYITDGKIKSRNDLKKIKLLKYF